MIVSRQCRKARGGGSELCQQLCCRKNGNGWVTRGGHWRLTACNSYDGGDGMMVEVLLDWEMCGKG